MANNFYEHDNFMGEDLESLMVKFASNINTKVKMIGHHIDKIFNKKGELIEVLEGDNLVVNTFLNLTMALLKGESGYGRISYWAIGSGSSSWDSSTPTPSLTDTKLTAEIGRVAVAANEIAFLNSSYNVTNTPTNILQIKHTFGYNDCNGSWREFGLFGGNATSAINSGIMVNKRNHGVITKTNEISIERTMRFTLSLV